MKWFRRFLIFCIFNAILVTGEELFLLTDNENIYRYNTKTKETKKIAKKALYMACDYERNLLYYVQRKRNEMSTELIRMVQGSDDIKTILGNDKVDPTIMSISVDQETGNVYYSSSKGIEFLSYTQNYRKTITFTYRQTDNDPVFYIGFHGKGSSKRVYLSTLYNLYRSEINTTDLINLRGECQFFSIFDNGMVCGSLKGLYLANLDGVEIESPPNSAITPSILGDIESTCVVQDPVIVYGNLYILCYKQVLKLDLKTGILYHLIPTTPIILPGEKCISVCPLTHQDDAPIVTILPVSTILMVVTAVVLGIVLIVSPAVTILKCTKKHDNMPKRSNHNQGEESIYFSSLHNRETHVTPMYTELNAPSSPAYVEIL